MLVTSSVTCLYIHNNYYIIHAQCMVCYDIMFIQPHTERVYYWCNYIHNYYYSQRSAGHGWLSYHVATSLGSRPSPYVRVYFECFPHAHNENAHVRGRPGTEATIPYSIYGLIMLLYILTIMYMYVYRYQYIMVRGSVSVSYTFYMYIYMYAHTGSFVLLWCRLLTTQTLPKWPL